MSPARTVDLTGNSLDEIHAAAEAQCPDGFELTAAPVRMIKSSTAHRNRDIPARRRVDDARDAGDPCVLRWRA